MEAFADMFKALPGIRLFEGKQYKSRKDGLKQIADSWSLEAERAASSLQSTKRQVCQGLIH